MSKRQKPETLQPAALGWLTAHCGEQQFNRVLALLDRKQIPALIEYVRGISNEDAFQQFITANLSPEQQKAEAERRQREEDERRTIREGDQKPVTAKEILSDGRWIPLGQKEREEAARAAAEKAEGEQMAPIEEAVF